MVRFEILLPLYYNDGRPIEEAKFIVTNKEFIAAFGATSTDTVIVRGRWMYRSILYEDKLIRVCVDVEDTSENRDFIVHYKETLKTRFEQEDIWITAQQVEVI